MPVLRESGCRSLAPLKIGAVALLHAFGLVVAADGAVIIMPVFPAPPPLGTHAQAIGAIRPFFHLPSSPQVAMASYSTRGT